MSSASPPATSSSSQAGTGNGQASNVGEALQQMLQTRLLANGQGGQLTPEKVANFFQANMPALIREGKITKETAENIQKGIIKSVEDHNRNSNSSSALRSTSTSSDSLMLSQAGQPPDHPVNASLTTQNPGPVVFQHSRPTLSGGYASGRMSGTPALIKGPDDALFSLDDIRPRSSNVRKNGQADASMRKTVQDLVSSVDPGVRIEPEVEDLLLNIADEFIDSVTNFSCRLAKHRGGETLEVRDLQLHLERNHNIRIPGFGSDDTRLSLAATNSQSASNTAAQAVGASSATGGSSKRAGGGTGMSLRSQRLAQVQAAKREAKLV